MTMKYNVPTYLKKIQLTNYNGKTLAHLTNLKRHLITTTHSHTNTHKEGSRWPIKFMFHFSIVASKSLLPAVTELYSFDWFFFFCSHSLKTILFAIKIEFILDTVNFLNRKCILPETLSVPCLDHDDRLPHRHIWSEATSQSHNRWTSLWFVAGFIRTELSPHYLTKI